MTKVYLRCSVSALMLATAIPAFAQGAPSPAQGAEPSSATPEDGEIIVTAERRSTSAQRTSVAVTVLTSEDLVRKSVTASKACNLPRRP